VIDMSEKKPNKGAPKRPTVGPSREIPLAAVTWEKQLREEFDEPALRALAEDMDRSGQQQPILVRGGGGDHFAGVWGQRRFKAAVLNGWTTIRAEVLDGELGEADILGRQLSENEYREGLQPVERAKAYRRLMDLNGWTAKQLAEHLGVSAAKICTDLKLLDLHPDVQKDVDDGLIAASTAAAIATAPAESQAELAREAKGGKLTREQAKAAAKAAGGAEKSGGKPERFKLTLKGKHFDFEVTGNTITVKGKPIDSASLLGDVVDELLAAVRSHVRKSAPGEDPPPAAAKAAPKPKTQAPVTPPSQSAPKAGGEPHA
jgi:ParB family chromosome partitioning protein